MQELSVSDTRYQVTRKPGKLRISTDRRIIVEDAFFDWVQENWVFAVQAYDSRQLYHVDYLFLTPDFALTEVLREDKGVNPQFLTAPDGSLWVSLSSTSTARDGEIVLPLQERSRITKEIVRREEPVSCYFTLQGKCCAYVENIFDPKGADKLLVYEFDKKGLYKTRKTYKLPIRYAAPAFLPDGSCLVTYGQRTDQLCSISTDALDVNGSVSPVFRSEPVPDVRGVHFLSSSAEVFRFLTYTGNLAECLTFSAAGKLLHRESIYHTETPVNCMLENNLSPSPEVIRLLTASKEPVPTRTNEDFLLLFQDGNQEVFAAPPAFIPELLDSRHILLNPFEQLSYFEIAEI